MDNDDRGPSKVPVQSVPTESSSASSDSCWAEMEDLNSNEDVEWGLTPPPRTVQTPSHSVPLDVLSALEQDLCENVHGSQFLQEVH